MSSEARKTAKAGNGGPSPTVSQAKWLSSGVAHPGGKLPLFDADGQRISSRTVRICIDKGWAEPWFENPIKPDWMICKLTDAGRKAIGAEN